ncbi:MAG: SGNH/GDSL hydrolase family protein [Bacteroidota bacterium]
MIATFIFLIKKHARVIPVLWFITIFVACEADIETYTPDPGEADFSTYVAVGNSLTAGFANGDLYKSGQENSFPNILADQFQHVGLTSFNQPLMNDELGFGNRLVLQEMNGELMPVDMPGDPDPGNFDNIYPAEGPFHNMGVPGAKVQHMLIPGYGILNPYFGRFASDPTSATMLADATDMNPTFFTLWAGSNDILNFATSGGEGDGITPVTSFSVTLELIINQLTASDARGAIANIVDITGTPFFSTIPYNALEIGDEAVVNALNDAYAQLPHIHFATGNNAFLVADEEHEAGFRHLTSDELVLLSLPMEKVEEDGWGTMVPIPQEYYLSEEQIIEVQEAVTAYNDVIETAANQHGLAHVDVHTLLSEAESGIYFDAIAFSNDYISGGVFSLDGIHLTARGNAIVANEFITAINHTCNASVPKVPVGDFKGILFP